MINLIHAHVKTWTWRLNLNLTSWMSAAEWVLSCWMKANWTPRLIWGKGASNSRHVNSTERRETQRSGKKGRDMHRKEINENSAPMPPNPKRCPKLHNEYIEGVTKNYTRCKLNVISTQPSRSRQVRRIANITARLSCWRQRWTISWSSSRITGTANLIDGRRSSSWRYLSVHAVELRWQHVSTIDVPWQSFHLKGIKTCLFILSESPLFTAIRCYRLNIVTILNLEQVSELKVNVGIYKSKTTAICMVIIIRKKILQTIKSK